MRGRGVSLTLAVVLLVAVPSEPNASPPVFGGTRALNLTAPIDGTSAIDLYNAHATDGAGNRVAMWTKVGPDPVHAHGNDVDLMVARSSDDGCSWSEPELFPNWATTDVDHDYFPDVVAGGGAWVAVWASTVFGNGSNYGVAASRSIDNGVTWSTPIAVENNTGSPTPRVAYGQGAFVSVWLSTSGPRVSRSTDGGVTWSPPTTIPSATLITGGHETELATDGGGGWVVVWTHWPSVNADRDVYFSRSTDNGLTWSVV